MTDDVTVQDSDDGQRRSDGPVSPQVIHQPSLGRVTAERGIVYRSRSVIQCTSGPSPVPLSRTARRASWVAVTASILLILASVPHLAAPFDEAAILVR